MNGRTKILAGLAGGLAIVAGVRWANFSDEAIEPGTSARRVLLGSREVDTLPVSEPTWVEKYGAGALQFGELRLPEGRGAHPVVVVIHGGCWTKGYATVRNTAPMASDLAKHGVATWNIEYRQVGDEGGGWPGTFLDWGAAVDHLRVLQKSHPLDLTRVVVTGHSAGAHAALWIAARGKLAETSEIRGADPLPILAVVAIDGPGDLAAFVGFDMEICGQPVVSRLMGGDPIEQPGRYREASPRALLPLGLPQYLVAASVLTPEMAQDYQKLARAAGDVVEVLTATKGGHFAVIAPRQGEWEAVRRVILEKALGRR